MRMPAIAEVPARCHRASLVAVALLGLAASIGTAQSQTAQPPAAEPPAAALAPAPSRRRGRAAKRATWRGDPQRPGRGPDGRTPGKKRPEEKTGPRPRRS